MFEAIWKGLLLGLPLIISVGPVFFTIIKQSVNYGKPAGFSFVAGVWTSDIMWAILANFFLDFIQDFNTQFHYPIAFAGSIFLFLLGLFNLFFKKANVSVAKQKLNVSSDKYLQIYISGFLINTLNPAVIFFWAITAPAFAGTLMGKYRFVLFATCLALNISADFLKVILAGKLGEKLNDKTVHRIDQISGFILILFGLLLLLATIYSEIKK